MSYLEKNTIDEIKKRLNHDKSSLGKVFRSKKNTYQILSVDHELVSEFLNKGWEIDKELKTKTRLKKIKDHNQKFTDDVWCQFYNLGYRCFSDEPIHLPYDKDISLRQQIDIIIINDETLFLIVCKSSNNPQKLSSVGIDFNRLGIILDGLRKSIYQLIGKKLKVKFIFATRNLRLSAESDEIKLLKKTKSFYYNDNTFTYINSLIRNYKTAAHYQVLGLIFKDELIAPNKIEVPAVEGDMGGKKYYMFSIEPHLLLKMGFILHRTKANESEMPTYQRLLVPSRLKGIEKFLKTGGYFPNSIILNFSDKKNKIQFESSQKSGSSSSKTGILKIPNAYAIAYIIDGQHRVYGYSNLDFKNTNTIPVVAFKNLTSIEQLEIFMDINQNQKAVSPSLRLTLEEDLFWDSERLDSRLKALRSSIVKELSSSPQSPLYNKIQVGEDLALLTFKPFYNGLKDSGLLPKAKVNTLDNESLVGSLYDVTNTNINEEMYTAKNKIVQFINLCYELVEEKYSDIYLREKYFILSNRGSYAFISLIGNLNKFISLEDKVSFSSTVNERFEHIEKYLISLFEYLEQIVKEEEEKLLSLLGSGADIHWLRFFQNIINSKYPEYFPSELKEWRERQDKNLQDEAWDYSVFIEKTMKKIVLEKLISLFGKNWDLEIGSIKRECLKRAEEEKEKNYKEGISGRDIDWTEMFSINDYKTIILKYWTNKPKNLSEEETFFTFENDFSIDIGEKFNSKAEKTKWIAYFNSHRNSLAHEGTKDKGLTDKQVRFLERIDKHFHKPNYKNRFPI